MITVKGGGHTEALTPRFGVKCQEALKRVTTKGFPQIDGQ
jgi:hypothetical protein